MSSRVLTRRGSRKSSSAGRAALQGGALAVPGHFRCPISLELMTDPVTLPTGITYDRHSIETWLEAGHETCPVTKRHLAGGQALIPNHTLRRMIQDWCVANRKHGVERIPTPRIPVTAADVAAVLFELTAASQRGDSRRCLELVARIRSLARESERNRRCFTSNGAAAALSAAFAAFSVAQDSRPAEEIVASLTGMFPLGAEPRTQLTSPESLRWLAETVQKGSVAARGNAVLVLDELVKADAVIAGAAATVDGMSEGLVKLIKEPISLQASKASLVVIFCMASSGEEIAAKFAGMGVVPLLLDALVDCDKSTTEKVMGVLDALCNCRRGRQEAYQHALTIPLLVKKILRVSAMTTEFSISILWKLLKNANVEDSETAGGAAGCVVEALRVGAFQKLLLLLQVGCGEATKEKASGLLKLLNASRRSAECIDTADFKAIKRPF